MAGRRKLKKISLAQSPIETAPLDLRPNTILNPKERVVGVEVDNPNKPDEKIIVWRSTRDPLFMLYAQGAIDEPQRMAGEHWRECYRLCEIGGVRGQDLTREYVDTSHTACYEPVGDRQIRASKDLKKARQALGEVGEFVVNRVLGEGLFPKQIAELFGETADRKIRYWSDRFREALQTLAVVFTYCS